MYKLVNHGICTIRNEEDTIYGWAKMMSILCENVTALVDPHTSDRTIEVLENEAPWVNIEYQDRSLGDTDNEIQGKENRLIMHVNLTKWINTHIKEGEWFISVAADERFDPNDLELLKMELSHAKKHGYDSIAHTQFLEPIPGQLKNVYDIGNHLYYDTLHHTVSKDELKLRYCINWGEHYTLQHIRVQQMHSNWKQNDEPHHGFENQGMNPLLSKVPLWHFHRIKYNKIHATSHRDAQGSIETFITNNNNIIPITYKPCGFDWQNYLLEAL